ncbi:hypothetical protein E8E13_001629 [Curvularia kusanoi]|uniref:Uncharacterized protein n=1 Tax=Curvularia kusanoi TaxID=90978 RepID=A0A9P4T5V3_CURKU|nr:hypothetical protein E8E13_001629 [Curvularia kusanoi]
MASSAGTRRKRDVSPELGEPAPKVSKKEEAPNALSDLEQTVNEIFPDLLEKLDSVVLSAFQPTAPALQDDDAEQLVDYLESRFPGICELDATMVSRLHKSLRKYSSSLGLDDLLLFLQLSHDRNRPLAPEPIPQARVDSTVKQILREIIIINKTKKLTKRTQADDEDKVATLATILTAAQPFIREVKNRSEGPAYLSKHSGCTWNFVSPTSSMDDGLTLDDIHDSKLRKKTRKLQNVFLDTPVSILYEVLLEHGGSLEMASSSLRAGSEVEL